MAARRRSSTATPALLRLDDYLPYRLSVAAHAVATLIAAAYQQRFKLPIPQWRVLAILSEHRRMRQQDIVPLSTMDKQTVSRAVRALRKRGLLRRRVHPGDARAWTLSLSAAGLRLYAQVVPLALSYERELKRALAPADRAAFERGVRRLELTARRGLARQPDAPRAPE